MTALGIVSMILFLSITWGGFVGLLAYAVSRERRRTRAAADTVPATKQEGGSQ